MIQEEPVDRKKVAELKSQGSKAVARKDFLSAAEAYSMVHYGIIFLSVYPFPASNFLLPKS
jgi:hypothetical protein